MLINNIVQQLKLNNKLTQNLRMNKYQKNELKSEHELKTPKRTQLQKCIEIPK